MFELLNKYKDDKGCFYFTPDDNLKEICEKENVPDYCCGIYIVFACFDKKEVPVYIGSSGRIESDEVTPRIGGLRRRIRGKQKDIDSGKSIPRGKLWPQLMKRDSIRKLKITWCNTGEDNPLIVEYCFILEYIIHHKRLPAWNNELKLDGRLKNDLEKFIKRNDIKTLEIKPVEL